MYIYNKNGNIAVLPVEITSSQINDALLSVAPFFLDDNVGYTKFSTVKSAIETLHNKFRGFTITSLFIDAGFFTGKYTPQPFMVQNDLVGELSDIIDCASYERKRPSYFITPKGLAFLELVLLGLRRDMNLKNDMINNSFETGQESAANLFSTLIKYNFTQHD